MFFFRPAWQQTHKAVFSVAILAYMINWRDTAICSVAHAILYGVWLVKEQRCSMPKPCKDLTCCSYNCTGLCQWCSCVKNGRNASDACWVTLVRASTASVVGLANHFLSPGLLPSFLRLPPSQERPWQQFACWPTSCFNQVSAPRSLLTLITWASHHHNLVQGHTATNGLYWFLPTMTTMPSFPVMTPISGFNFLSEASHSTPCFQRCAGHMGCSDRSLLRYCQTAYFPPQMAVF